MSGETRLLLEHKGAKPDVVERYSHVCSKILHVRMRAGRSLVLESSPPPSAPSPSYSPDFAT
eukprot:331174-Hanusia_phi.AAC.1